MSESVVIIGAGGHAHVIADIIERRGDSVEGVLDDKDASGASKWKFLGKTSDAPEIHKKFPTLLFIIGIGNNNTRKRLSTEYSLLPFYTAIHPSAIIARDCVIGEGTVIAANAVVNPESVVGKHCIINTAATVDHDCKIGDYVHLCPGVHLAGTVKIGQSSMLGISSAVINNISICESCVIGAGAIVTSDITDPGTYVGVSAKKHN